MEGIFHDAHEVYVKSGDKRTWIGTFATKGYAEGYTQFVDAHAAQFGVYPDDDESWEVVPV